MIEREQYDIEIRITAKNDLTPGGGPPCGGKSRCNGIAGHDARSARIGCGTGDGPS